MFWRHKILKQICS